VPGEVNHRTPEHIMTFPTATSRALVATVSAFAILASGCATDATPELDAAEPASSVPDVAGDPDLDTGEDPDGGVLVDDPDEDGTEPDGDASGDDVVAAPIESRPTAKPPTTTPVPAAKPVAKPVAKPAPKPATPAPLRDGAYEGRLVRIDRQHVTVDLVQILSGEAARKAAEEAGDLDEDGTLPNDVYVKDLGQRVTVAVAGDGGFQVYDCSAGCELVGTTLEALVDGSTRPYGGANAHFSFRVDHGEVISLVEVYLP
jgi:hypothetical protein